MKKDKNSNVSIKQILITAVFTTIITFGGLNAYRIVSLKNTNTILEIESANLGKENDLKTPKYETALVENTEDDVIYSENIKFLAANTIDAFDDNNTSINKNNANENNINESISQETIDNKENNSNMSKESNNKNDNNENTEDIKNYITKVVSRGDFVRNQLTDSMTFDTTNNGKLLNSMLNGIKELSKKQEDDAEKVIDFNAEDNLKQDNTVVENNTALEDVQTNSKQEVVEQEGVPTNYVRTIDVKATAYCLCKKCCGKSPSSPGYGVTASGLKIIPGTGMKVVASDPNVIPLGTKVYVEGLNGAPDYGYAIVADTGSAVKNLKIDLYVETHEMALNWGIKNVRVYILDN